MEKTSIEACRGRRPRRPGGNTLRLHIGIGGWGSACRAGGYRIRPYNLECSSLETVGTGVLDGPAVRHGVFTLGFGGWGSGCCAGGYGIRPYNLECSSLETVGASSARPAARPYVSTLVSADGVVPAVRTANGRPYNWTRSSRKGTNDLPQIMCRIFDISMNIVL